MYSKVIQLYIYMSIPLKFFPHLGCYIILSRVPCAIQSMSLLVIHFKNSIHIEMYHVNPKLLNYPFP